MVSLIAEEHPLTQVNIASAAWAFPSMLRVILGALLIVGCGVTPRAALATAFVGVRHSQTYDAFVILDELSQWHPGHRAEYRLDWERRFGPLTPDDKELLATYTQLRREASNDPQFTGKTSASNLWGGDDLFAPATSLVRSDRLSNHFEEARSLAVALRTLPLTFGRVEGRFLQRFYRHFADRYALLLAESAPLDAVAQRVNVQMQTSASLAYADRLKTFYGVDPERPFGALIVWWPPVDFTAGRQRNGLLVIQLNPRLHAEAADTDGLVAHEYVHYVSAHQSPEERRRRTAAFLRLCPTASEGNPLRYLEEPLAVILGNAVYAEFVAGSPSVTPPIKSGYGFELIHSSTTYNLQGRMEQDYTPDGLRAELVIPLGKAEDIS